LSFRRGSCIDKAVVAALHTPMLFVAGNQQETMLVAPSIDSKAGDLTAIIDVLGVHQIQRGASGLPHPSRFSRVGARGD